MIAQQRPTVPAAASSYATPFDRIRGILCADVYVGEIEHDIAVGLVIAGRTRKILALAERYGVDRERLMRLESWEQIDDLHGELLLRAREEFALVSDSEVEAATSETAR